MPKVPRRSMSVYHLEEKLCTNMRNVSEWAAKNTILENLTRFQSNLSPRSRMLMNVFNPKQYKIANTSASFLSPFSVVYKKKVAWVIYRMNAKPEEDPGHPCMHLVPLITSFSLWDYLLDHPYQSIPVSVAQLSTLFPQWTTIEWTTVVEKLDSFFKQINDTSAIRVEMKRMTHTDSSHYPWWKDDDNIRPIHDELKYKLDTLEKAMYEKSIHPSSPITQELTSLPTVYVYIPVDLSVSEQTELVNLSKHFYEHYRRQISMAEIQHCAWYNRMNRDEVKKSLDEIMKATSVEESFPNHYGRLKEYFQSHVPKPSNEQLFQIWRQSKGDWEIIHLI